MPRDRSAFGSLVRDVFSSVQIIPLRSIICPSSNHLAPLALRDLAGCAPSTAEGKAIAITPLVLGSLCHPDNTKPMETKTHQEAPNQGKKKYNKGGRPKSQEPRTKRIDVRCSYFEQLALQSKADEVGLPLSEYLRRCGLDKLIPPALTAEELEVYKELKRYATNFVQIANFIKNKDQRLFAEIKYLVKVFNDELQYIKTKRYGKQSNGDKGE